MPKTIKILADATLPGLDNLFGKSFSLSLYRDQNELLALLPTHEVLVCRSTLQVGEHLLKNTPIRCVATASSGIDHIDIGYLKQNNIVLLDAKGSNAQAVADYVVATIAALITMDKFPGKKAGVIGVGLVGSCVVERLRTLDFDVLCCDPPRAQQDNDYVYYALNELADCDLLCIHPNLHQEQPYPSSQLINKSFLDKLKPNVTIINAARGGIIDEAALLAMKKPITYCTDVFWNEPAVNPEIIDFATLCTPHIAGHTVEAKIGAVVQLSQQIKQYYLTEKLQSGLLTVCNEETGIPFRHWISKGNQTVNEAEIKRIWAQHILSIYNPLTDTHLLKSNLDKKSAFLTQRKAHYRKRQAQLLSR